MQFYDGFKWSPINQLKNQNKYSLLQNHVENIRNFLRNPIEHILNIEFMLNKLIKVSTINQTFHLRKCGVMKPLTLIEFVIKLIKRGLIQHLNLLYNLMFHDHNNYVWHNERYFDKGWTIFHQMFYKKNRDNEDAINAELIKYFKIIIFKCSFSYKYIHQDDIFGKTFFYYFLQNMDLKYWSNDIELRTIFTKYKLVNKPFYFQGYSSDLLFFNCINCSMLKPLELFQVSSQGQSRSNIREKVKCLIHFHNCTITKKCYKLFKNFYENHEMNHLIKINYMKQKLQKMHNSKQYYVRWFSKFNLNQMLHYISDDDNIHYGTLLQLIVSSSDYEYYYY